VSWAVRGWAKTALAISVLELALSLARMRETWVCTVLRDKNSPAAISGLDRPSATKYAMFRSVGVSASQPESGRRFRVSRRIP
jgi:hypothetical protein